MRYANCSHHRLHKKAWSALSGRCRRGCRCRRHIRLRNTSQLAGFAKREDLAFRLQEGFGIGYEYRPDLAPTDEILDAYKADRDWVAYERAFLSLLSERRTEEVGRELLARYSRPCLLCAEPIPDHCHRRLVAEWWATHLPDVEIIHL